MTLPLAAAGKPGLPNFCLNCVACGVSRGFSFVAYNWLSSGSESPLSISSDYSDLALEAVGSLFARTPMLAMFDAGGGMGRLSYY